MLLEELIERAFSDGYEYAQKEFADQRQIMEAALSNTVKKQNRLAARAAREAKKSLARESKKSLVPSSKSADMWEKIQKARESALKAKADFKRMDPMPAKATGYTSKVSRPAPFSRQAQRAGNPFSRASQFLSGPGGLR